MAEDVRDIVDHRPCGHRSYQHPLLLIRRRTADELCYDCAERAGESNEPRGGDIVTWVSTLIASALVLLGILAYNGLFFW